jgi:hypothetical protein
MAKPSFDEFMKNEYKTAPQQSSPQVSSKPSFDDFVKNEYKPVSKQTTPPQTNPLSATNKDYTEGNTVLGDIGHKAGVAVRSALEGVASVPVGLYNTVGMLGAPNAIDTPLSLPKNIPQENDQLRKAAGFLSDVIGLPKATADDKTTQQLAEGLGGLVAPAAIMSKAGKAGGAVKAVGDFLGGANPMKTAAAVGTGILAGNVANEATKDSTTLTDQQKNMIGIAANVAGNVGASGLMGIAQGLGRAGSRTLGAVTGNVEPVAGRFLNRAAGEEAPLVQSYLESGKVPNIEKPILGYQPRSSEIAANAGISGAVRHAENDIMNSTQLAGRDFANQKTIKDFLQRKTAGTQEERDLLEASLRSDAAAHSQPFKQRNADVNLDDVRTQLTSAIEQNKGNPAITNGLKKLLDDMPSPQVIKKEVPFINPETGRTGINVVEESTPVGFKEAYNYKQYIDEMLRGNAFDDPVKRSIQQAGTAMGGTKKALSDTLTSVEPEFAPFLQRQAQGISKLERKKLADSLIEKLSANNSIASNQSGTQETIQALSAPRLGQLLKNDKIKGKLSPDQIESFTRAAQHAGLKGRGSAGMPRGSNTAQNLKTNELVMDDIVRSLAGDKQKSGMLGNLLKSGANIAANSPVLKALSPVSSRQQELSAIFAKAELDPKYMAELMKKYNLKDAPVNPTARGALGAGLTGSLTNKPRL